MLIRLSSHKAVCFLPLKARLSNVVEAEPDCKVAMDILSFALYHENNGEVAGVMPKVSDAEDNSDESSYGDDELSNKRRRLDDEEVASSKSNSVKAQIWEEVVAREGELPLEETCTGIEDRNKVIKAVDEMVQEGRLMVSDGIIYMID
jgi:hypothetical protein